METFDPIQFGFALLRDFQFPGGIRVYEYINHPAVDGTHDFLRLNLYLSKDGSYVVIWHGLLEPVIAEARLQALANIEMPMGFDMFSSYCETLFRGHIDSAEAAAHVLKALRVGQSAGRNAHPQILNTGTGGELRCEVMRAVA